MPAATRLNTKNKQNIVWLILATVAGYQTVWWELPLYSLNAILGKTWEELLRGLVDATKIATNIKMFTARGCQLHQGKAEVMLTQVGKKCQSRLLLKSPWLSRYAVTEHGLSKTVLLSFSVMSYGRLHGGNMTCKPVTWYRILTVVHIAYVVSRN